MFCKILRDQYHSHEDIAGDRLTKFLLGVVAVRCTSEHANVKQSLPLMWSGELMKRPDCGKFAKGRLHSILGGREVM